MSEESVVVVCPNPKCQREIEEPILLTNLSVTPTEEYDACPYCFTKLEPETTVSPDEVTDDMEDMEELETVQAPSEDEPLETAEDSTSQVLKDVGDLILSSSVTKEEERETAGCPEDFGYLANRPKDTPIPQECLVCPKMVDCMLKIKE